MSVNLVLSDNAHSYGLDNFYEATAGRDRARLGSLDVVVESFPYIEALQSGDMVRSISQYSNGFDLDVFSTFDFYYGFIVDAAVLTGPIASDVVWTLTGDIGVSPYSYVTDLANSAVFSGDDVIVGNNFNNTLEGWRGNDHINGLNGTDTVVFFGFYSEYAIARSGAAIDTSGPDGMDALLNVERLQFDDYTLAYDTNGTAGQAYRLYQAAFDRMPDIVGLGNHIKGMDLGTSLKTVAQNFLNSSEFASRYGQVDNAGFVTKLYNNVLHRDPEAAGFAFHMKTMSSGSVDRAQLLINFSESAENQAALIGVIENGMLFQA